jgi:hypothetical protein
MLLSDWLYGRCTWVFSWSGWVCILIKFLIDLKEKLLDTGTKFCSHQSEISLVLVGEQSNIHIATDTTKMSNLQFHRNGYLWDSYVQKKSSYRCASSQYWQQITIWYLVHPLKHSQWWSYSEYLSKEFLFHEESSQIDCLHEHLPPCHPTLQHIVRLQACLQLATIWLSIVCSFLVSLHVCFWSSGPEGVGILQNINFLCIEQSSIRTQQLNFLRLLQGTRNLLSQFEWNS